MLYGKNTTISYDMNLLLSNTHINTAHPDLETSYFIALSSESIVSDVGLKTHLGKKVLEAGIVFRSNQVTLRHCTIQFTVASSAVNMIYVKQGEFVFDFSCSVHALLNGVEVLFNPFINGITAQTSSSGYTML